MATYKVWLTVKNSAGATKEIDVGNINVDVDMENLTPEMLSKIEEALSLKDYLKKDEIPTELATDAEVATAVQNTVKYSGFKWTDENIEEAGN
jgi:effector-binding domain-containing protein